MWPPTCLDACLTRFQLVSQSVFIIVIFKYHTETREYLLRKTNYSKTETQIQRKDSVISAYSTHFRLSKELSRLMTAARSMQCKKQQQDMRLP